MFRPARRGAARSLSHGRTWCTAAGLTTRDSDHAAALMELCADRHYIARGRSHRDSFLRGLSCSYGPLGTELHRNILDQWWNSVSKSNARVFGIGTLNARRDGADAGNGTLKVVDSRSLNQVLDLQELSKEQLVQRLQKLLKSSASLTTNFLTGALDQYLPSLELVNRKLPFGLAESGPCFQTSDGRGCPAEVTQTSLVWFCSPRTSSQWLDHWARQRLQWWRKFALAPSDFSCSDISGEEEPGGKAWRGVKIVYHFPWGQEPLETLQSRGNAELLQMHESVSAKLQCLDDHKLVVPHVVSITGNMDRGMLAYLFNSLQQQKKEDTEQKLQQRKVLKLHPLLAPVKVALHLGGAATVELRQVCEGLLQDLVEAGISSWPGYLETTATSGEQSSAKYDEMGVLFTVVIDESTLESGLLQVRSRDTTVKEIMHISEVKRSLNRYIAAAKNV
ncbi:DNA polymerase subunit gamma-2, mitochondrial [Lampris incognitus]|uniref:DNA polymerase subunit gamma-2, mitochondrial n=1 Tax=Lampris incognitus TaxID=2546036 RepID=UPI0024B48B65|nr:DNA polymerase subunit gamma-2, mitochondrial [Lampris incognitus]